MATKNIRPEWKTFREVAQEFAKQATEYWAFADKSNQELETNNARVRDLLKGLPDTSDFEWIQKELFTMKDHIRHQQKLIKRFSRKTEEAGALLQNGSATARGKVSPVGLDLPDDLSPEEFNWIGNHFLKAQKILMEQNHILREIVSNGQALNEQSIRLEGAFKALAAIQEKAKRK